MFKKGYYNHSFFKKGDMTPQDRMFGNFRSPHMVHAWVKAGDNDLKQNVKAGNALEKRHK
jgi:hypothetical protein